LQQSHPQWWQEILTCAFFEISETKPLYLCKPWVELSYEEPLSDDVSSQRISELLRELGEAFHSRVSFFELWAERQKETNCVFYDITSLSSYSKIIEWVEWGYNRDKEKLPQINLGVVCGEPLSLPLFYGIHQGSIPDVATLKNALQFATHVGLRDIAFIMDKGFYSKHNLNEMRKTHLRFIIPYPESNKSAVELIHRHSEAISSPRNTFRINNDILFGIKDRVSMAGAPYSAFVYLDEKRKLEERDHFFKKLIDLEERLKSLGYETKDEIEEYLSENVKDWRNYLRIRKKAEQLLPSRNLSGIDKVVERMGMFILLTNYGVGMQEAISLYRKKDAIEKYFDRMKNDLDVKRLRVHTQEAAQGRLFLCFITLILYSWINRTMTEQSLYKDYTIQEIIYELKKIKRLRLDDNRTLTTEISKKQKELFKSFQIDLPQT
jgi:transposase